jgi:hypothetical protein
VGENAKEEFLPVHKFGQPVVVTEQIVEDGPSPGEGEGQRHGNEHAVCPLPPLGCRIPLGADRHLPFTPALLPLGPQIDTFAKSDGDGRVAKGDQGQLKGMWK